MLWILWMYLINTFFILIVSICEARRPAKALNWLIICLILPVIGFGFYLIASNPVRIRRQRLTSPNNESDSLPDSFSCSASIIAQSVRHLTVHGLRMGGVQVLTNGVQTFEQLIESLRYAQKTIDLEYYIYRDDQIGRRITDLLIQRAATGVRVRLIRDGWGSRKFPQNQITRMIDAGIECRTIFPLRLPWIMSNWNYRDHCKIVIIDGKEGFTGGINVGYEYTGLKPNIGFWRDSHFRIAGEAAIDLQTVFDFHWNIASPEGMKTRTRWNIKAGGTRKPIQVSVRKSENIPPTSKVAIFGWSAESGNELGTMDGTSADTILNTKALQKVYIQTLEGNPGIPTQVIREAYFICLTQAHKTIDITTPYFVPDADIIMSIKTAVARGVRVRLLVPSRYTDFKTTMVGAASRTYYGELLEAGVQIYLYEKGVLHAKLMVIDEEIAQVGSANYDFRSYRLNYEVCEILYSKDVARELTKQFDLDLTDSVPLRIEDLLQRSVSQRILDQAARLLSPML